ncbi:glycosyltransferase family 4 protein [Dinoroseobacter sp. S375]|uniref:glycosyltransferase family 4 protein n=1 Tax=Dinoroseobacter sp. S375 TaxID=3415136 RepID=UPI003C7DDA73
MRIAVVSHIRHPIARPFMGGMEAHSWSLVQGLRARGHDVTLLAAGDSDPALPLCPIVPSHYDAAYPWHQFHGTEALNTHLDTAFARAVEILRDGTFDVIHNNTLHRYLPRLGRAAGLPMVTSLHIPPFDALRRGVEDGRCPWARVTVCSEAHGAQWWDPPFGPDIRVVPNGIDLDTWPFRAEGDGTAVWSGRITPTKGLHLAIAAARQAGLRLRIYGVIEHRDYFEAEVAPALSDQITYEGHLDSASLARALSRASVLAFTPCWEEPFGLVAIEAMACGVPVAALPRGGVAEVVGPGGVLTRDSDPAQLARALRAAMKLDRRAVQQHAERRYGLDRMMSHYETLYGEVIAARPSVVPEIRFHPIEFPTPVPKLKEAV